VLIKFRWLDLFVFLMSCLKLLIKALNNRSAVVADEIVSLIQSPFVKGRFLLESVVLLHETIHRMHKTKKPLEYFLRSILKTI
jgi:hypothetical protein